MLQSNHYEFIFVGIFLTTKNHLQQQKIIITISLFLYNHKPETFEERVTSRLHWPQCSNGNNFMVFENEWQTLLRGFSYQKVEMYELPLSILFIFTSRAFFPAC